jgi:hypothetical protein
MTTRHSGSTLRTKAERKRIHTNRRIAGSLIATFEDLPAGMGWSATN